MKIKLSAIMLAMLSGAAMAGTITVPESNSNASFVEKGMKEIDFGQTIKIDEKGYPDFINTDDIYDEYDYQGAVSAYLQSVSQMALYGSVKTNYYYGATEGTDSLIMYKDPSVDGMLTPNRAVTYLFNYPNLEETGPLVYEYPAGGLAGIILDIEMKLVEDLGLTSKHGGKAVKYLIHTEGQTVPDSAYDEYEVVEIPTNLMFFAFRVLDPSKDFGLEKELKIYPYAERENPTQNKFYQAKETDDTYFMTQPKGMKYWEQLHEYIQVEKVAEEDRYMMARLKAVGIEKGKPFNPTERQKKILEKAALVGEKMAMTISFVGRGESDPARYRQDSKWRHPLTLEPSHREGFINQLEEKVDWAYEAYGISHAMKASQPGKGSTYLGGYQDSKGKWLEGEKNYKLHIEADVPAARFWDVSVYDIEKRALLPYKEGVNSAINSSTMEGLIQNADGSYDIYFGPGKAPKGLESNFITTEKGVRWFTYFRLYGPTETYLDRSWKMNNIEEIK